MPAENNKSAEAKITLYRSRSPTIYASKQAWKLQCTS